YLMRHGINIPKDIAVVGFNNDSICKIVEPELSTIHYPGFELGEHAANALLNQINNEGRKLKGENILIDSTLIIRNSSIKIS
ncbi:MAG: substrate-binding domain-containing protein, partial [Chitinophagaceae bacterium]